jgi:transcriptional regulator with XRE-family HTH domain
MMSASPVLASWELGLRLRERREAAGLTATAAAKRAGCTQGYLSDVERGNTKIAPEKLDTLLAAYEFSAEEADELRGLREEVNRRGWWQEYSGIYDPTVLRMFGLEHGAKSARIYENLLITGLLQTEEYAQALSAGSPIVRAADSSPRLEARMLRQQRLSGEPPLKLSVVMSEGALRQQVGGPEVLRGQLRHLAEVVERHPDTVDLRVVPFAAGRFSTLGASTFFLFDFPSTRLPVLLYQESVTSLEVVDRPSLVREYAVAHYEAQRSALSREDTLAAIRQAETEL